MKTYLRGSFNRYKRFREKLDVRAILCNKRGAYLMILEKRKFIFSKKMNHLLFL